MEAITGLSLGTGEDKCHGSKCLLAWDKICCSKECGGLGIKKLSDQNHCLLVKFVHRLLDASPLPWKTWFLTHSSLLGNQGPDLSYLAKLLSKELPLYRQLTSVQVGNGLHTSFWHHKWLLSVPLAETFPALFSHCIFQDLSVRATLERPLDSLLRPRLTRTAADEKQLLLNCLEIFHLNDAPDCRYLTQFPQ